MATPKVYVICDANCKFESLTREQILTAITQAVNEGTIGDIDTGFVTTIKTLNGAPLRFFVGTQAEYEALTDDDKTGLFAIISNDTTKEGILTSLETLRTDLDGLIENLNNGRYNAANATNDGEGRNIIKTYAATFNGYVPLSGNTVVRSGTIMVYWESSSNTAKHIGDKIASGAIGLEAVGSALYAKPYNTGGASNKVNKEAIVLGQISADTNGRTYLIQFI